MGTLHVSEQHIYHFEDRTLAHLRTVITNKLLQQESFMFTWVDAGLQRSAWIHPASHLVFEFESPNTPEINRAWAEELFSLANSPGGLRLVDEPNPSA